MVLVAINRLSRDAGALHRAHEPAHRRRADLLGSREVAERFGTAHEDGEGRQLRRRDAGQWVGAAGAPQQMDRRGVQAVGDLPVTAVCASGHLVILVSKAN